MGIAKLNSEIDRSNQLILVLGDAIQISAGDVILVGSDAMGIAVEVADGATARAVSVAANEAPNPDRTTILLTAEDVTLPKKPGVDTIAVGTKVWWDDVDGFLVTSTGQSINPLFSCGFTVLLSDDSNDEVAINFDGRSEQIALDANADDIVLADDYANYATANVEDAMAEIGGVAYANRFTVTKTIEPTAEAAAGASYGKIFIATRACTVKKISEVHTVAGDDGSAVTLHVERLQGTETSGNGDDLHTAGIDLKGTAETPVSPTLLASVVELTVGDRLNLVDTGTLTSLAGLCVTIELEWDVADNS